MHYLQRISFFNKTRNRYLPGVAILLRDALKTQEKLMAAIEASPELFKKPRSATFLNIKLGFKKQKGSLTWKDDKAVVRKIKEKLPEVTAQALIVTTEKPSRDALARLSAADLKKLGVSVVDSSDVAFIKPADSDGDKLIKEME